MDRIEITYYTDPLCCWSWGFEPQWRKLQYEFQELISWRYCMTGLIPSWNNYSDPMHSVNRPIQMGPVWMHASQLTGMPMQSRLWMENPPASSYPACIAFKSAELQSKEAGERMLRLLREAVMLDGKNIAKTDELLKIAGNLADEMPERFDLEKFSVDLKTDTGMNAFRQDVNEANTRNINRTPTLVLKNASGQAIMLTGYRPYEVLLNAMKQILPSIPSHQLITPEQYRQRWPGITERELKEIS